MSKVDWRMLRRMGQMKVTSKRQATLPAALCRDLGIEPGDTIQVERPLVITNS